MKILRAIVALLVLAVVAVIASQFLRRPSVSPPVISESFTPVTEQRLSHGRFNEFTVYIPHASPKGFVLLLSGQEGWTAALADVATRLAAQGTLVAGLDTPKLNADLESDGGQCVYPDGDLENLSHFVQAYLHLPTYLSPILAGYSTGGTLAYATLVQAPKNTFAGAVSLDFCPNYPLSKPLCKGSGIEFNARATGKGVEFHPAKDGGLSWTVVQRTASPACDAASVQAFATQVPGSRFLPESAAPATAAVPAPFWSPQFGKAIDELVAAHPGAPSATVPATLSDLPIITVPAETGSTGAPSDTFAIILSGDGGWAGLDKDVAGALSAGGIPVIGLDSLRYFWSARTPQGLANDIDRLTRYYLGALAKQRVLLIGYSQGADVLPFAVNRLSADVRSHVALTAVMGMSEHALFEFHVSSWISDDDSGPPTLPEVDRILGTPVLCIYGEEETDTLCPKLDPHKAIIVKLKGGHHFDGDYANLAKIILSSARTR